MRKNYLLHSLRDVFCHSRYAMLALIFSASIGIGIVWLSDYRLIWFAMTSDIFDWTARLKILWTSLGMFATNFTFASQVMTIIVSVLAGINVAMLIFYFKRTMAIQRASGASVLGIIIGTFGVGCSACGSVILSSLIGVTTASTLVSQLPLRGAEFGIAGIALIGFSIYLLAKKIQSPNTCLYPNN